LLGQLGGLERLVDYAGDTGGRHTGRIHLAARRQENDGYSSCLLVGLQAAGHLIAVHFGHHDIHQDGVGPDRACQLEPRGTGRRGMHVPACGELERPAHQQQEIEIVVDDERPERGPVLAQPVNIRDISRVLLVDAPCMNARIYILDDDITYAKLLAVNLGPSSHRTRVFDTADELLARCEEELPDAVITDMIMPNLNGVQVTQRLRALDADLPVFVLTGHADMSTAIEALKAGANEYLTKPVNIDELTTLLTRALKERPLRDEVRSLEETRTREFSIRAILGEHPKVEEVRGFVRRVADIRRPTVLLLGESGTGKNLVARAIHHSSPHSRGRFVELNCAAMPSNLVEAELFGYNKGAFTDAREAKRGLIETANGGTLFLDEIAELTPEIQAKLLSFLESRRFRRLGGTEEIEVELRLVTATNRDLADAVRTGRFRTDLYYRIAVASHTLPPLREIISDLPLLADHYREVFNREFKKKVEAIDDDAMAVMRNWHWPGNVRELRNVIERSLIFCESQRLGRENLPKLSQLEASPAARGANGFRLNPGMTLVEAEREYIRLTLEVTGGDVQRAAEMLGISRKNLWEKRKKHGLPSDASRTDSGA
jgi:two-component system, NtrC family, response regulator AtoC